MQLSSLRTSNFVLRTSNFILRTSNFVLRTSYFFSVLSLGFAAVATAQTYGSDARRIGLGGAGSTENVAAKLVDSPRPYGRIVLPFGLIQVLGDLDVFDPNADDYDPVRSMEYAANPVHYTFGRRQGEGGHRFISDLMNARLERDLNRYRGFSPASGTLTEGLTFPEFGRTLAFPARAGAFHGVYVGGGPYLATQTAGRIDPALVAVLSGSADTYVADTSFGLSSGATSQLALAATVGYRGRLALPGASDGGVRGGIYLAANLHYLHGLWLDGFDMRLRLETDAAGLVATEPSASPVLIERVTSGSGRGMAVDLGMAVVVNRWQVGVGANGIANRLTWRQLEREEFALASVIDGSGYTETVSSPDGVRRISLPVDYLVDVGYHADRWSALAEYGRGFMGSRMHGGVERRFGAIELRGGIRFNRDQWHPSAGLGVNLRPDVGLDVALFSLSTSLERRRQTAVAVSLRFAGLR
jgi:hypothetical protein